MTVFGHLSHAYLALLNNREFMRKIQPIVDAKMWAWGVQLKEEKLPSVQDYEKLRKQHDTLRQKVVDWFDSKPNPWAMLDSKTPAVKALAEYGAEYTLRERSVASIFYGNADETVVGVDFAWTVADYHRNFLQPSRNQGKTYAMSNVVNTEDERKIAAADKEVAEAVSATSGIFTPGGAASFFALDHARRTIEKRAKLLKDVSERKERERLAAVEAAKPKLATPSGLREAFNGGWSVARNPWDDVANFANNKARDYYFAKADALVGTFGYSETSRLRGDLRKAFYSAETATKSTGNEHA